MKLPGYIWKGMCPDCGGNMVLRYSKRFDRLFYGCGRWPECNATHGAHPDGEPLGIPANQETKNARIRAHAAFDGLWKGTRLMRRAQAYSWMQEAMEMTPDEAHIGRFTKEECERLVEKVNQEIAFLSQFEEGEEMVRWDRSCEADP